MADKKKDKPSPQAKKSGGLGALALIWLLILTGISGLSLWLAMNSSTDSNKNIEQRVAKLEARSGKVKKKITPAGSGQEKDFKAIENRILQLEKDLKNIAAAPQSISGEATACDCQKLSDRIGKLESDIVACQKGTIPPLATLSKAEPAPPKKIVKRKKRYKKKRVARIRKKRPRKVIARRTPEPIIYPKSVPYTTTPSKTISAERQARYSVRSGDLSPSRSIYDISRSFGPTYGYTSHEQRNLSKLAPGAAVYPDPNSAFASTSSTYIPSSFSE